MFLLIEPFLLYTAPPNVSQGGHGGLQAITMSRHKMKDSCQEIKCTILLCLQNSSTYWEGKADAESLQRIYGISFPDPKQLKEWKHFQEEAAKRDHRKIGRVNCDVTVGVYSVWMCAPLNFPWNQCFEAF